MNAIILLFKKPVTITAKSELETVSVISACYNHGEYAEEMVASVLAQSYPAIELIIVDDGSDEATVEILKQIREPRVRVFFQTHGGPARARNLAIAHSTGSIIMNLDADDIIAPTFIERSIKLFSEHADAGIVYSEVSFFGAKSGLFELPEFSLETMLKGNCIVANACFRKCDWESTGGYSSALTYGYEDYDFWLSILERGRKVYKIEEPLVYYRTYDNPAMSRSGGRKSDPDRVHTALVQAFVRHRDFFRQVPEVYDYYCFLEQEYYRKNPCFSVITCTFQRKDLLLRSIKSIQNQTFTDYEHIIVDDGNDPLVSRMIAEMQDKRIHYIAHSRRQGGAAALNTGIHRSRGRYITILDDDDEFYPELLEKTLHAFEKSPPEVGLVWTGIRRVQDSEAGETVFREEKWPERFTNHEAGLVVATAIANSFGVSIKKRCFDTIGLFDENLNVGFDTDLFIRLCHHFQFITIPDILVKIHKHGTRQLTNTANIAERISCYQRILLKNRTILKQHPASHYIHSIAYASHCYQVGKKRLGRKSLVNILFSSPSWLIIYLDIIMFELHGMDFRSLYPERQFTKYLIRQTGFRYE